MKKLILIFMMMLTSNFFGQNADWTGTKTFKSTLKFVGLPVNNANTKFMTLDANGKPCTSVVPTPEPQVQTDWNATSGLGEILNKPSIPDISGMATNTYVDAQDAQKVDTSSLSEGATENTIPVRKSDGRIEAGTAVDGADVVNLTQLNEALINKQETLISGTNIKTVNGSSLIGYGDITINAGSTPSLQQVNNVNSDLLLTASESAGVSNTGTGYLMKQVNSSKTATEFNHTRIVNTYTENSLFQVEPQHLTISNSSTEYDNSKSELYLTAGTWYLRRYLNSNITSLIPRDPITNSQIYLPAPNTAGAYTIPIKINGKIADNNGNITLIGTTAPTSSAGTGTDGEIRVASGYVYWYVTGTGWLRSAGSTF